MPEPWELLPGRSFREGHANGRINLRLAAEAGLLDRSTLLFYEIIEFEPSPPGAVLQLDDIRRVLKQELPLASTARGCFGNAQQPIMVIPNLYLFARGSADPAYLDQPDQRVLADLAAFLGGPADLLIPAWSCLRLDLDQLPADLPERLRAARLQGEAAQFLPGGPNRYLDILAAQVRSRLDLLGACRKPASTPQEAAQRVVQATAALVNWWKVHRFVGGGTGDEPFHWNFVPGSQVGVLRQWCARQAIDRQTTIDLAAADLAAKGVLPADVARARLAELWPK